MLELEAGARRRKVVSVTLPPAAGQERLQIGLGDPDCTTDAIVRKPTSVRKQTVLEIRPPVAVMVLWLVDEGSHDA